jgi:hypothetical protein
MWLPKQVQAQWIHKPLLLQEVSIELTLCQIKKQLMNASLFLESILMQKPSSDKPRKAESRGAKAAVAAIVA